MTTTTTTTTAEQQEHDLEQGEIRKSRLDCMAEAVVGYMVSKGFKRGDLLPHSDIERITSTRRRRGVWITLIEKIKRLYRDKTGIELWPVNGDGYRLCTVDEQTNLVPKARQRRARKQIRKGIDALNALNPYELSDHQQKIRSFRLDHMGATARKLEGDLKEQAKVERSSMGETMRRMRIGE